MDGIGQYLGPTLAYRLVAPLIMGVVEKGSPKFQNLLGKVTGVFLGLILFLKLTVLLTVSLGDGITYVLAEYLNRQIPRVVTNFVNLHMTTAETFMVLHETNSLVTANVVNRFGLRSRTASPTRSRTPSRTRSCTTTTASTATTTATSTFCYRYDELTYMHRLWGFGQGKNAVRLAALDARDDRVEARRRAAALKTRPALVVVAWVVGRY